MADNVQIKDGNAALTSVATKEIETGVHASKVLVIDGAGRWGEVDQVGGYNVTMGVGHHKRHEGEMFRFIHRLTVPVGGQHDMVLKTGAGPAKVHIVLGLSGNDKIEAVLYKGPTYTGGTDVTANAYNICEDNPATPAQLTILDAPTVTATGTLRDGIFADKLVAVRTDGEHILQPGTDYLIRLDDTVIAKGPSVYMFLEWYEQTDAFTS